MKQASEYSAEVQRILEENEPGKGDLDTQPLDTGGPLNEIDVYVEQDRITFIPKRLQGVEVNGRKIVDSVVAAREAPLPFFTNDQTFQAIRQEGENQQKPPARKPLRAIDLVGSAVIALYLLLLVSTLCFELYLTTLQPSATITIVTPETSVTTHAAISLPAHLFTPLTFIQTQTVPTTGRTHQNATQATGLVTFFNGLTQQQVIPAGTLLIGADGEQVTTNTDAYVPAGNLTTNGQVPVYATAINSGEEGNIKAGDIFGPCCRAFIQVLNGQFSGGQNARDYQSVAKADIQHVVSNLSQQFQQTLRVKTASLAALFETLLTPTPCTTSVASDHPAGAEATQVTVTLRETCTPASYNTDDLQHQAAQVLAHAATQQLGTGYSPLGSVETSIEKTTLQKMSLVFTVACTGMWAHDFNVHQLATLITGKSQQAATAILHRQNGITHIAMQVSGTKNNALPTDPAQIHVLVIYDPVSVGLATQKRHAPIPTT